MTRVFTSSRSFPLKRFVLFLLHKHGAVSSVDLNTTVAAVPDASAGNSDPKPSVQALVYMEADGRIGATEAAIHALVMTHNLMHHGRRLRVSFLSGERLMEK